MTHHATIREPFTCWCLWDAGELSSVHSTRDDATAARANLLADHLIDFPSDRDDLEAALMIEPTAHNGPDPTHPQAFGARDRDGIAPAISLVDHGDSGWSSRVCSGFALDVEAGS